MRNKNRLNTLYNNMYNLHKNNFSDWRFTQLILNYLSWHLANYGTDGFYVEDNDFIHRFNKFIDEMKGNNNA